MVSVREHARSAMAALDRRNSILDDFVGLNWSSWIDRVNIKTSEGTDVEECCKKTKKGVHDTMTLGKDDMFTYGHCPAHDDFFLVVCNHCGQVVKPQAFEKHCERRHGPVSKFCGRRSPPPDPKRRSRLSGPVSHKAIPEETRESGPSTGSPQSRLWPAKAQEWVSLPPVERPSQETPLSPPHLSSPQPRVSPWPTGPLPRGGPSIASSSSEKPPLQKTVAGTGLLEEEASEPQDLWGPWTYKKVHKKECDLNKHCGVLDPGKKKRCTRQLMCNIHSIHQRRQVVGRSKTFDQLVTDLRTGGPAGSKQPKDPSSPPGSRDPPPTAPKVASAPTEPPMDRLGARNSTRQTLCSADLRSREPSETGPEAEEHVDMDHVPGDQRLQKVPYPSSQGLPSSGEESGGEEEQEMEEDEGRDLPASSWHPKPLGLCTFGSRTLSCSVFTFDRRLHHLRFAVSAMVEQQIGARLWTKIPQVTSGLQSPQATSTHPRGAGRSTGRVGGLAAAPRTPSSLRSPSLPLQATGRENWSSSSPASISSGPTSSGQSETNESGSHNPFATKPPANQPGIKPQPSAPSGPPRTVPERPREAVGRPSKARPQELELSCSAVKEKGPRHNSRKHPQPALQERGWTQPQGSPARIYSSPSPKSAHSSQGPINCALSLLGKKPCPSQTRPAEPQASHWALPGCGSTGLGKCPLLPVPPLRHPHPSTRGRGSPSSVHRRPGVFDHRDLAGAKRRKTSSGSCPSVPPFPLRGWKHRGQHCNTN